jgi:hypothetical protein
MEWRLMSIRLGEQLGRITVGFNATLVLRAVKGTQDIKGVGLDLVFRQVFFQENNPHHRPAPSFK